MKLTEEMKASIDALTYVELLRGYRFDPIGSPRLQSESGQYWLERMALLLDEPGGHERHVAASKSIGWEL